MNLPYWKQMINLGYWQSGDNISRKKEKLRETLWRARRRNLIFIFLSKIINNTEDRQDNKTIMMVIILLTILKFLICFCLLGGMNFDLIKITHTHIDLPPNWESAWLCVCVLFLCSFIFVVKIIIIKIIAKI